MNDTRAIIDEPSPPPASLTSGIVPGETMRSQVLELLGDPTEPSSETSELRITHDIYHYALPVPRHRLRALFLTYRDEIVLSFSAHGGPTETPDGTRAPVEGGPTESPQGASRGFPSPNPSPPSSAQARAIEIGRTTRLQIHERFGAPMLESRGSSERHDLYLYERYEHHKLHALHVRYHDDIVSAFSVSGGRHYHAADADPISPFELVAAYLSAADSPEDWCAELARPFSAEQTLAALN